MPTKQEKHSLFPLFFQRRDTLAECLYRHKRRFCVRLLFVLLLLTPGLLLAAPAAAQEDPESSEQALSFTQLGVTEQSLRGPSDASYISFGLPSTWRLSGNAALRLNFNTFFAGDRQRSYAGTLQVQLNGVTLEMILLDQAGEQMLTIPITMTALEAVRSDGQHVISLILDTNERCDSDDHTSVIIRPSSTLILPHQITSPPADLARLPSPLYQRSFLPNAATVVVPDAPDAAEIQAALTVAAGLGRMSGGDIDLTIMQVGKLRDSVRDDAHLIVVGRPKAFPLLDVVQLPAPVRGDGFAAVGAQPGDGIIQIAPSPWNDTKVVLVVGGDSDAAVIKAARAFSAGDIRGVARSDLALVADIQPQTGVETTSVDHSFADLGYSAQKMYGLGGQYAGVRFDVPAGQVVGDDAYIDLVFVHTALLDYNQSAINVNLNDDPIASVRLDDSSTRLGNARLPIPASALHSGSNQLTIRADLIPRAVCTDPRINGLWLTIQPESLIHLPLTTPTSSDDVPAADLSHYPLPFTAIPNLSNMAFVLAANDPAGWQVATDLALDLGARMQGTIVDAVAVYGDGVTDELRKERDLLLVGRPDTLNLVAELGNALPAPFPPGSVIADEPDTPVIYRLEDGASLGYIELLASPWNHTRSILAVLGSTDEGLRWAGTALVTPELRGTLRGNLAVIQDERIDSRDTRPGPDELEQATPTPEAGEQATAARPGTLRLLGVAGVALAALAAVVVGVVWWMRRRARRARVSTGANRDGGEAV